MSLYDFEADLDPSTRWPRVRFNFANGWTGSLLVKSLRTEAIDASVCAWPTGQSGTGKSELGPNEASADEAIVWLYEISKRARP